MPWEGEERRRAATTRDVNRVLVVVVILLVALVVGGSAFSASRRQADMVRITCGNAHGHQDLTIAVQEAAQQVNRIAAELGLPIEPVEVTVPEIPEECMDP
jgi:hypothetical protein